MTDALHPITLEQLEEGHSLILGTTGSGKTYQLRGLLEQLRRAGFPVGAVDKLGNHWGLTMAADGKAAGLEFVIFGGKRAQVPMSPGDGARIGRLFVEKNIPAIFDVSQWHGDDQQMWVAAFADAVFTAIDGGSLHLAFDEAQSWVPQGGGGEAFRSVQRLAEQGRGNGLRLLLTCQRLARLDATVREMMRTVVVMRQKGTIDRKAVRELVAETPADLALLEQLSKLPTGTGLLWDEAGDGLLKVKFPPNATFDSSRTPRHGDKPLPPIASSSALVDELKALLAPPPPETTADYPDDTIPADPAAAWAKGGDVARMLKERDDRIDDLEAANRMLAATATDVAVERDALAARIEVAREALGPPSTFASPGATAPLYKIELPKSQAKVGAEAAAQEDAAAEPMSRPAAGRSAAAGAERMAPPKPPAAPVSGPAAEGSHDRLPESKQAILDWTRWATVMFGRGPVRRELLAQLVGKHVRTKTFINDLGALRSAGLIDYVDGVGVVLTEAGLQRAQAVDTPGTPAALRERLKMLLAPSERRLFDIVVKAFPQILSREYLAAAVNKHVRTKTFINNLGRLHSLGFVTYAPAGGVRAAEFLMRRDR